MTALARKGTATFLTFLGEIQTFTIGYMNQLQVIEWRFDAKSRLLERANAIALVESQRTPLYAPRLRHYAECIANAEKRLVQARDAAAVQGLTPQQALVHHIERHRAELEIALYSFASDKLGARRSVTHSTWLAIIALIVAVASLLVPGR